MENITKKLRQLPRSEVMPMHCQARKTTYYPVSRPIHRRGLEHVFDQIWDQIDGAITRQIEDRIEEEDIKS